MSEKPAWAEWRDWNEACREVDAIAPGNMPLLYELDARVYRARRRQEIQQMVLGAVCVAALAASYIAAVVSALEGR